LIFRREDPRGGWEPTGLAGWIGREPLRFAPVVFDVGFHGFRS